MNDLDEFKMEMDENNQDPKWLHDIVTGHQGSEIFN